MTAQVELDWRPCDDNHFVEVKDTTDRDDNVAKRLKTINTIAEVNENYLTTDAMLSILPEYELTRNRAKLEDGSSESSCIKVTSVYGQMKKYFNVKYKRNTRALAAAAPTYKLETFEKNAMIIFNQRIVNGFKNCRGGIIEDGERIGKTLEKFGFEGEEHFDLTRKQIFKELKKFSSMDFTDYGCLAIVVMTYTTDQGLLMAKDKKYSELHILNYFKHRKKPKLVTKPVILIIQACRGIKQEKAAQMVQSLMFARLERDSMLNEEVERYHLPVEADTVVLHNSYWSKASHRERNGTWFIKSLCEKIDALSITHDLESILVEVKREVYQINGQMPVVTSALTRKLYLRKFGDEPPMIQQTATANVNIVMLPSTQRNCVDNVVISPYSQGESSAEFLNHYQYMQQILEDYVKDKKDTMAEYLLRESTSSETKCNANHMQMTLIAMSIFIKDKYRDTEKEKFICYYEIV